MYGFKGEKRSNCRIPCHCCSRFNLALTFKYVQEKLLTVAGYSAKQWDNFCIGVTNLYMLSILLRILL